MTSTWISSRGPSGQGSPYNAFKRSTKLARAIQEAGGDFAHLRMGRFAICLARTDVFVSEAYPGTLIGDAPESTKRECYTPGGTYYESTKADRLSQIRFVRTAMSCLPPHPLADRLESDMAAEELHFTQKV